jgi:hypothetical protein
VRASTEDAKQYRAGTARVVMRVDSKCDVTGFISKVDILASRARLGLSIFNQAAATCSHTYFLAGSNTPEFIGLSYVIGTRSVTLVDTAIAESLRSYVPPEHQKKAPTTALAEVAGPQSLQVPVTYIGDFNPDLLQEIDFAISRLLGDIAWTVPLDRLDGITFADDYPAALLSLDRGNHRIPPPKTRQDSVASGIAQCPIVIRNGVIKSHVVALGNIGRMLVGKSDKNRHGVESLTKSWIMNRRVCGGADLRCAWDQGGTQVPLGS